MGIFAIASYRPYPDTGEELLAIVRDHMPLLRSHGLVTDRPAYVMRSADGTILEIFEWKSTSAKDEAHRNPEVRRLWERFERVATFVALGELDECRRPFANFEPIAW